MLILYLVMLVVVLPLELLELLESPMLQGLPVLPVYQLEVELSEVKVEATRTERLVKIANVSSVVGIDVDAKLAQT